jgi:ABC-type transport system involved in multi-copper enzyme maturation permease subunit
VRPVLVVAGASIREASRRWIVTAFAAITIVLVSLSAWGFDKLSHTSSLTSGEVQVSLPQALILFMFMFSFVVALSASAMASPAIASDAESGVLQTIVTRPVYRYQIMLGKWVGLASVVFAYAAIVTALEVAVVYWVSGFVPPNPIAVGLYLFAEGLMLLTLALLLSTRLSAIAAGVVGIALFGGAWLGGVVGSLGSVFNIGALRTVGSVARYIVPTDGLWHGAIYYLEPKSFLALRLTQSPESASNPFFASAPPTWIYLLWVLLWLAAIMGLGLWSFEHKEL